MKPCSQTDRGTDERTNKYTPMPPSMEWGIEAGWLNYIDQKLNLRRNNKRQDCKNMFYFKLYDILSQTLWNTSTDITQDELLMQWYWKPRGLANWGWINIKLASCQYRKSFSDIKTILHNSYLQNRISYIGKTYKKLNQGHVRKSTYVYI